MPSFLFGNKAQKQSNAANDKLAAIAREEWDLYKANYLPVEKDYIKESWDYSSPSRYAQEAGKAQADVSNAFGKARDRLSRTPGLDPSSSAFTSAITGLNLAEAANEATAQNAARKGVYDTGMQLKQNVISTGKGLQTNAMTGLTNAASGYAQMAGLQDAQNNRLAGAIGSAVGTGLGLAL